MGRWVLRAATGAVIAFLYTPIAIIALYAFNAERIQVWPIRQFSTEWFGSAWDNPSVRAALGLSIQVGLLSSLIAIVLGSLAAFAVHRFRFFYNNVIARLRRSSHNIEEASMDLGADTWQTFRYITFPVIRTAVLAGGLLAFALSFDEIVVTTFTAGTQETIPIWIFNHLRQANQRPIVNVVALVLILLSTIPVYLASRLTTGTATSGRT